MAGIKEKLIQVVLRGKDLLSPEAKKGKDALNDLRTAGEELRVELEKNKETSALAKSLIGLEKDSQRAEIEVERANKKVLELQAALDKAPDSKGIQSTLKAANTEANRAEKAFTALKQETEELTLKAKAAGIDTSKLAEEEKRLATELDKAKKSVSDNAKATKDLEREQRAAARAAAEQEAKTTTLGKAVSSVEKKVLAYAAAYVSVNAAMKLVGGATSLIVNGFKSVFTGASESEQILAQLNAALTSTGNEVGLTADELARMATEMRKTSMLSTEEITEMQVALLTYTDIAKEEFPQALQIAIDQQQRLGIGISQSAELVGMALQSPSKAMVALGRQGFKLEEDQKRLLKQFEDTGKMAEAQAIIMEMLAESYGGSAAAARYKTFDGLWKGITDTFDDFKSKIADSGAFDHFKGVLEAASETLTELQQDGTIDKLAESISKAFIGGMVYVENFVKELATVDFKRLIDESTEWLNGFQGHIETTIKALKNITAPIRIAANAITGFGAAALTAFSGLVFGSLSLMKLLAKAIPDMFGGDVIVSSLEKASDKVAGLMTGLAKQVGTDFNDIKGIVSDLLDDTDEQLKGSEDKQVEILKKSYKEKKISVDQYAESLKALKKTISELAESAKSQREASLSEIEAIYQSSHKLAELHAQGLLSAEDHAAAQKQLEQALDDLKIKVTETEESFEDYEKQLKETQAALDDIEQAEKGSQDTIKTKVELIRELEKEQERLRDAYFESKITQEEWQDGHNAAQQEITKLIAAVDGAVISIEGLKDAEEAFDNAKTVTQLENLKKALFDAYDTKKIDFEEFQRLHNKASAEIAKLGNTGKNATKDLTNLKGILIAIDKAANDLDISAARTALTKLYREGKIDADELKKAQEALNAKVAELKPAAETAAKSFKQSQEEQRKEIGKTLEENRRASGEAMEDRRRNGEEIKEQTMQIQSFFDEVLGRARDPLVEMSEKALAAFDALQGLPAAAPKMDYSSVEGLTEALAEARNELNGIRSESALAGSMASGFSKWAVQTLDRSKQIQIAYLNEKMAMQQLIEQYNTGAIGAAKFAKSADEMRKNAELLGEADLSGLTSAIDAAKSKMDQLAQSTRSTLQSLNDELLQLKGTQEEIEAAKMQSRKDDLRQQLAVAQKDGDAEAIRNLRQALNTLAEIEAEKERQLRNQRAEEAKAEAQKAAEEKAKAQPVQQQPAKVIQLQAAGQSVSVGIDNDSDELALLRILEQAGMRTVR